MPVITRALEDSAMQTLPLLFSSQNSCNYEGREISDRAGSLCKKKSISEIKDRAGSLCKKKRIVRFSGLRI
jgi:hypothetical protein